MAQTTPRAVIGCLLHGRQESPRAAPLDRRHGSTLSARQSVIGMRNERYSWSADSKPIPGPGLSQRGQRACWSEARSEPCAVRAVSRIITWRMRSYDPSCAHLT